MHIPKQKRFLAIACAAILAASSGYAGAPFVIDVTATGPGAPPELTVSSSSFIDALNEFIDASNNFTTFNGFARTSAITFLGVKNALSVTSNAAGTTETMVIPLIGLNKTFVGVSQADVRSQVRAFTKANDLWGAFLAAIAKQSPNALTDGNPNAATANMAASTFAMEGFTPPDEIFPDEPGASPRLSGFGLGFDSGRFTAGGLNGTLADFAIPKQWMLSDNVGLSINVPISYLSLEGAKVFGAGLNAAVPVRIEKMDKDNAWNWRVAPLFGVAARLSKDLASGAVLWQMGLSNSIDYRVSPKLVVCLVNQLTYYKSIRVSAGGGSLDPQVKQEILKDGVRVVSPLTKRLIGNFFVLSSQFLQDAAVKQFTTIGGGIEIRASKKMNVQLAGNYDTGPSFNSWSIGLTSAWRY